MVAKWMILALSLFLITSCQSSDATFVKIDEDPAPLQQLKSSSGGLTLELNKTSYIDSPKFLQVSIKNTASKSCSYGDFFRIEQKKEGQWFYVVYEESVFQKYPNFIDIGYVLEPNSKTPQALSLKNINLSLPAGEYRVVKTFMCPTPYGKEITLSVPFDVTTIH